MRPTTPLATLALVVTITPLFLGNGDCGPCTDTVQTHALHVVEVADKARNPEEWNAVTADLRTFVENNANATAAETLLFLYQTQERSYDAFLEVPPPVVELLLEASEDHGGQMPQDLCQALCRPRPDDEAACSLNAPPGFDTEGDLPAALYCTQLTNLCVAA